MAAAIAHPYYPIEASIAGYSPNEASVLMLLTIASGAAAALLGITLTLVSLAQPTLRSADRFAILWFVLCKYPCTLQTVYTWLTRHSWNPALFLRRIFHFVS